jgi:hypothetical protein
VRVLLGIVQVGGVPETAEALGVAEATVKTHLHRLFAKTGPPARRTSSSWWLGLPIPGRPAQASRVRRPSSFDQWMQHGQDSGILSLTQTRFFKEQCQCARR